MVFGFTGIAPELLEARDHIIAGVFVSLVIIMATSKPCKKCGGLARYKTGRCVACQLEYSRQYLSANPEKSRARGYRWAKNNPEKARKWATDNPDKKLACVRNRRACEKKAEGSFTAAEWKALCKQYNNQCCYPGCDRTDLHADHVVPLSRGGRNTIDNIQPLCSHHNFRKGTRSGDYRHKPGLIGWIQKKLFG